MTKLKLYKPRELKIGDKFGNLTIVDQAEDYVYKSTGNHIKRWKCQCDNGHTIIAFQHNLLNGHTTHCSICSSTKLKNMVGLKFGMLTVIKRGPDYEYKGGKDVQWYCVCDCDKYDNNGNENPLDKRALKLIKGRELRNGKILSCGCYKRKIAKLPTEDRVIIGLNNLVNQIPYYIRPLPQNSIQGVTFLTDEELKEYKKENKK